MAAGPPAPAAPGPAEALRALHAALRNDRRQDAISLARELRRHYRSQGGPPALLRFVEGLLADAEPEMVVVAPTEIEAGSAQASFRLGAVRDGRRLTAVLALWRELCPEAPAPVAGQAPVALASVGRELGLAAQADGGGAFRWQDGWWRGGRLLLRLEAWPQRPVAKLVFCQAEAGQLRHGAALSLPPTGETLLQVPVANPLLPLLLAVIDGDGLLLDLSLLPFPSLLRGGLHHAELCATAEAASAGAFAWDCLERRRAPERARITALKLPAQASDGSEQVARPALVRWLRQVWGLRRTAPGCFARAPGDGQPEPTGLQLQLAGDGIPSLRALSGLTLDADADPFAGCPFIVVDPCDGLPLTLCRPGREPRQAGPSSDAPAGATDLLLPLAGRPARPVRSLEPVALHPAVELRDPRYPLLVPTMPPRPTKPAGAAARLGVLVLAGDDTDDLLFSLWGLLQQHDVQLEWVRILAPAGAPPTPLPPELAGCFPPGCVEFGSLPPAPEALCELIGPAADSPPTLVLRAGVCLHQPATLVQLLALLEPADVVSAGCLLVREQWFEAGRRVTAQSLGLHPETIQLDGPGALSLVERDLLGSLGLRDLSVVAAVPDLLLLDPAAPAWRQAWSEPAACTDLAQLLVERSLEAVLAGGLHRCSSRFSASYRRPPPPERRWWLPERLRRPLLAGLPFLLQACSLVQRLEP